tara:strand:- start:42481 stop:43413 length:933 start_codon:yes stop_codon:yes gene_type:complete
MKTESISKFKHTFSQNPLNRGESERRDEQWISGQIDNPNSKFMIVNDLNILIDSSSKNKSLAWMPQQNIHRLEIEGSPVLLGIQDDVTHFALSISHNSASNLVSEPQYEFVDARTCAGFLSSESTGIIAQARIQINWHNKNKFCSVCGKPNNIFRGGQVLKCSSCNNETFPRTDPVIIMVVTDGEYCLLGQSRGRLSQTNTYSALAGFMDQGESIEEAVAREVMEEAGLKIKNVTYHSSQPWPFPNSLMIGCLAEAQTTDIHMDDEEMVSVKWFNREQVRLALDGNNPDLNLPAPIAIAHHLIRSWADSD